MVGRAEEAEPGPLFFVHVMKTGGSTFRTRLRRQLGSEVVFPNPALDPPELMPNMRVSYLRELPPERRAAIRAYSGHFPFFATQLVPRPSQVITVLRDPVERAISYLKQHRADRGLPPDSPLEDIYDRELHRQLHILNYQVRVFATTVDDGVETVMRYLDIDAARLEQAKEHLRSVDILGLHEHYDDFVSLAVRRLGWSDDPGVRDQRVSKPTEVSASFRQRIAADNQADLEFYAFARELWEERQRERD